MQNQIQGQNIPSIDNEDYFEENNCLMMETNHIGIQLVRFDDENKRTSSIKVSMTPFLVPLSQANPVFD